jgi:hypothetical protein
MGCIGDAGSAGIDFTATGSHQRVDERQAIIDVGTAT